jgi:hypothetical protein
LNPENLNPSLIEANSFGNFFAGFCTLDLIVNMNVMPVTSTVTVAMTQHQRSGRLDITVTPALRNQQNQSWSEESLRQHFEVTIAIAITPTVPGHTAA